MSKKAIKMKDVILAHYQKVHELEMHGLTVRVWKPRTMQQLPATEMLSQIKHYAKDAADWCSWNDKATWWGGNPDIGTWDALLTQYVDPRRKTLDIYFAAILVRPFSRESYDLYGDYMIDLNKTDRLMAMFDSREYDRIHGFDTSYGAYKNQDEVDGWMYRVVNEEQDIADHSPSSYLQVWDDDEDNPIQRENITLRQLPDGKTEFHVIVDTDDIQERGGTPLMHAAAKCYDNFRKEHPEVTEMRFYTDKLVDIEKYADIDEEQQN